MSYPAQQFPTLRLSLALTVACGRTEGEAARRCRAIGRDFEQLQELGLAGTPERILERLGDTALLGCGRAYLQLLDLADRDHLQLLAEEVMRRLA